MTQRFRDFTDTVERWLATAPAEEDPESVVARVVAELDATPQQRWPWEASRRLGSNLAIGFGVGVAGTFLAIVVGIQLFRVLDEAGGRNPGAPEGSSSPRESGDIAYVHASYGDDRSVADVRIFSVSSGGDNGALLVDVPGGPWVRDPGWTNSDYRNEELVGPAISWSPDGARIAFRLFNHAPGIYVMNRDGSGVDQLVGLPEDRDSGMGYSAALDWSPDGTRIAYPYPYGDLQSPLYVVDTADGTVTPLTGSDPGDGVTRTVAWSPDGASIAFVRTEAGGLPRGSELLVMNSDGTAVRKLPTGSEPNPQLVAVAWSPDSSMIAFVQTMADDPAGPPERWVLRVINADGTGLRDVVGPMDPGGCCYWMSPDEPLKWSPDGASIAMIGGVAGDRNIVLVNPDGSGERAITEGGDYSWFDWSPDGSQLVVYDQRSYSIQVVNADGSGLRWLADGEFPAWAPDSGGGP